MTFFYSILTFIAGTVAPVQAGINATLGDQLNHFFQAAFISFFVGTLSLFCILLVSGVPAPSLATLKALPWWMWLGGIIGAFLVTTTIIVAPKLGATTMIALLVTGHLVASVICLLYTSPSPRDH